MSRQDDRYTAVRNTTPIPNGSMIVVKASCADEIRRIPILNQELTFDELCFMMYRLFRDKLSKVENLVLKYTDPDGDLVTLTDTMDVSHALEYSKVLRVTVFDKEVLPVNGKKTQLSPIQSQDLKASLLEMRAHIDRLIDIYCKENVDKNQGNQGNQGAKEQSPAVPKETKPALTTTDISELLGQASIQGNQVEYVRSRSSTQEPSYGSRQPQVQPQVQPQPQPQVQVQPQQPQAGYTNTSYVQYPNSNPNNIQYPQSPSPQVQPQVQNQVQTQPPAQPVYQNAYPQQGYPQGQQQNYQPSPQQGYQPQGYQPKQGGYANSYYPQQ